MQRYFEDKLSIENAAVYAFGIIVAVLLLGATFLFGLLIYYAIRVYFLTRNSSMFSKRSRRVIISPIMLFLRYFLLIFTYCYWINFEDLTNVTYDPTILSYLDLSVQIINVVVPLIDIILYLLLITDY